MRGKNLATYASALLWAALPATAAADEAVVPTPLPLVATSKDDEAQANLLQRKLAELDQLQGEIAELREATATPNTIYVSVQMLEVMPGRLRELGVDLQNLPGGLSAVLNPSKSHASEAYSMPDEPVQSAPQEGSVADFVEWMVRNNVARVLANPSLVTASGRPASLSAGGRIPIPAAPGAAAGDEALEVGARLDVVAVTLGANQVSLWLNVRVSDWDGKSMVPIDGRMVPRLSSDGCETTCTMQLGETISLGGTVTERVEARIVDGGRREERVVELARWILVHADDANNLPQREVRFQSATYDAP